MNKDEALKMAIKEMSIYAMQHFNDWLIEDNDLIKAINACKEALEQPAQEPDYWLGYGLQAHDEKPYDEATPLYLRPAQPLSDDEIEKITYNVYKAGKSDDLDNLALARAIEKAHGIGEKR